MNKVDGDKRDPIHLSNDGYKLLFDNCLMQYYAGWLLDSTAPSHYPKGVASKGLTQPFQGRRQVVTPDTQGSGVPQPWALLFNPFGIKNTP